MVLRSLLRLQRRLFPIQIKSFSTNQPPPLEPFALMNQITAFWVPYTITAAMNLNIPEILRDKGPQSLTSLASQTNASPQHIFRLLRGLNAVGFFSQRSDGSWENNVNSSNLITMRPLVTFCFDCYTTWGKLSEAVQTAQPQFSSVNNGLQFWDYLQKNPEKAKNFGDTMTILTNIDISGIVNKFPWEKFNGAKIMDVGGGHGTFLSNILREKCTRSYGILLDLPHSKDAANQLIKAHQLSDRIEFFGGSFFDPIPTADVIVTKHILHDWDDSKCLEILARCRQSLLKSTSKVKKLVVVDTVISDTPGGFESFFDLFMLVLLTGKERTQSDWNSLFTQAGFKIESISKPAIFSLIEAGIA